MSLDKTCPRLHLLIQIQTSNREGKVTLRRIAIWISSKVGDGVPSYNNSKTCYNDSFYSQSFFRYFVTLY